MIRIPILMYHSVEDDFASACVRPANFEEQVAYLHKAGYRAVDLDAVYFHITEGRPLPSKPIVISFDDGYRDNLENAYPVLKRYGMSATIFLPTGHLGFSNRWNAAAGATQRAIMTREEVRSAANDPLLSFQAHTCTHPRLTEIPIKQAREEIKKGKKDMEDLLGKPCHHLAYPYGDFNDAVRDAAEEAGFLTACTTRWGHNRQGDDSFALFRIGVGNRDTLSDFRRILGEPPPLWKYYLLRLKSALTPG
jgi:peptidoglycan/xylan/chitin deacetylase (PgdA/CDA1 family)